MVWDAKNKVHDVVKELGMWEESIDYSDDDNWESQECSNSDKEEININDTLSDNNSTSEQEFLQIYDQQEFNDIQQEINQLKEAKLIDSNLHDKLNHVSKMSFARVKTDSISMFEMSDDKDNSQPLPSKYRLLEIVHNGKRMFIHKTTVVWLFQEGERVSADRLFRVREIQPYTTNSKVISSSQASSSTIAARLPVLEVGNVCVFLKKRGDSIWQIGRVLQFAYYLEKTKKARQYRATTVNVEENLGKVGVLCSWFIETKTGTFTTEHDDLDMISHKFCPISCYICTLSSDSFEMVESIGNNKEIEGILPVKMDKMKPITTKSFSLTIEATQQIQNLVLHKEISAQGSCNLSNSAASTVTIDNDMETTNTGLGSSKQITLWLQ